MTVGGAVAKSSEELFVFNNYGAAVDCVEYGVGVTWTGDVTKAIVELLGGGESHGRESRIGDGINRSVH